MSLNYYGETPAAASPAAAPPKPGWKTTEFWLTATATLAGALISFDVVPETHWSGRLAGAIVATLSTLGYTAIRTRAKRVQP